MADIKITLSTYDYEIALTETDYDITLTDGDINYVPIPQNALLNASGEPIINADGSYILTN